MTTGANRPMGMRKKPTYWTPESVEWLRSLASTGLSSSQISEQVGCSQSSVVRRARLAGIKLQCTIAEGGLRRGRHLRIPYIEGNAGKIPLTKGYVATIDIEDIPLVSGRNWYAYQRGHGSVYAGTTQTGDRRATHLHRFLTGTPMDLCVDHIDGDPMNNRRSNLRICTYAQNCFNKKMTRLNTSGKAGVNKRRKKWQARIHVGDRTIRLGSFDTFEEAVSARVAAEKQHFGEFARSV